MDNRPSGRKKHVTEGGAGVHKRGEGLGTGPVGNGSRPGAHKESSTGSARRDSGRKGGNGGSRSSGGGTSPLMLIIGLIVVLFGGGNVLLGGLGSDSSSSSSSSAGSAYYSTVNSNTGWSDSANTGSLNEDVASGSREKYTSIKGNGSDTITIMVYMCGTDLESKSGMATSDLMEMAAADISDQINLIVFTGGCSKWNNNIVSNKVNQIYQVKNGGLTSLKKDAGSGAMTDPSTLASFIQYCKKNFPADRNELILWDHGGGSLSGYGYDEKNASSGSMTLAGIKTALKKADMKFDFVGFDACLMATLETGLMLNDYADYLVASEETEPGIGWYYTDWLNALSKNTSMPTIEIGQKIIDSFITQCNAKCKGQATTLSITDLAELYNTVPEKFRAFSTSTSDLMSSNYKQVSNARYQTREFAQSSKIDQIDLVHFAKNLATSEGDALAEAILAAVKYNKTSSSMTNAYGLSIYFPYSKTSKVDSAVKTYQAIGLDDEYSRCIQSFAKMEVSGQSVSSGTSNAFPSLSGSASYSNMDSQTMMQLLGALMGGDLSGLSQSVLGLDSSNTAFLTGKSISDEEVTDYVSKTQLDVEDLQWTENDGKNVLALTEEDWSMIHDLALNMFYDDGEGYIDLGLDNVYDFDEDGNLIAQTDGTWLAINGQVVPYYYDKTMEDENGNQVIYGYIPAFLNGDRVKLLVEFDEDDPDGRIIGASNDYQNDETETQAKSLISLETGDKLDFVCDYYSYDGDYQDSYYLGESMTVEDEMSISNVDVGGDVDCMYRLTDIYNQTYWTPSF